MKSFDAKWNDLRASSSAQEEAARVEDVTANLRQNRVQYELAVSDVATGTIVPVAELGRKPAARLRVDLTLAAGGAKRILSWEPRDPANVLPLLRE